MRDRDVDNVVPHRGAGGRTLPSRSTEAGFIDIRHGKHRAPPGESQAPMHDRYLNQRR